MTISRPSTQFPRFRLSPFASAGIGLMVSVTAGAVSSPNAPRGAEFLVGDPDDHTGLSPGIASDALGNFVVVWEAVTAGQNTRILARRYTASGVALGEPFEVNQNPAGRQGDAAPDVAMEPDGDFVVSWVREALVADPGGGSSVHKRTMLRRYSAAGVALSSETVVGDLGTSVSTDLAQQAVAVDASGDAVVVWSQYQFESPSTVPEAKYILAQRISSTGVNLGSPIVVNTATTGFNFRPDVAMDANGAFAVVWERQATNGEFDPAQLRLRRFNASGLAVGSEATVAAGASTSQRHAAVAMDADGDAVIAWQDYNNGSVYSINARRYLKTGAAGGDVFVVAQDDTVLFGPKYRPEVAMSSDGTFAIATSGREVYIRQYASDGSAVGSAFLANEVTSGAQDSASIAADADGDLSVAWQSNRLNGVPAPFNIFARQFAGTQSVDLSVNQTASPSVVQVGETLTYNITVSNLNTAVGSPTGVPAIDAAIGSATGVRLTQALPPDVTLNGVTGAAWGCAQQSGILECDAISPLAPEASESLQVEVIPTAGADGQIVAAVAVVEGGQFDAQESNNNDTDTTPVGFPCVKGTVHFALKAKTVDEGRRASFLVQREGGTCGSLSVQYEARAGTASLGPDYAASAGTLTWADADGLSKTVSVSTLQDEIDEDDETISLRLLSEDPSLLSAPSTAVVTIRDDDAVPVFNLEASASNVVESAGTVTVTARLSGPSSTNIRIPLKTSGTAVEGKDYGLPDAGPQIVIPAGDLSGSLAISVLDDALDEMPEQLDLAAGTVTGARPGDVTALALRIADNDPLPSVSFKRTALKLTEGETGFADIVLSAASGRAVALTLSADGTAKSGRDFAAVPSTIIFPEGTLRRRVPLTALEDTVGERRETVTFTILDPTTATIGEQGQMTLTILNKE